MSRRVDGVAVELFEVAKRFGTTISLDQFDLRIARGTVFGLLGANGAGKTTTLRILLGLVKPDAGRVDVLGFDPHVNGNEVRRRVGVLLEHDGLYGRLSAHANLDYFARIHRLTPVMRSERIETLLRSIGLWERRHEAVVTWSKGMRQKLAIARALIAKPELVLLDEPFSGLDPVAAAELRRAIIDLSRGERTTVVMTTHDLAHVEKTCDEVAVLSGGRVIASGAPSDLVRREDLRVNVRGSGLTETVLVAMATDGYIASYAMNDGGAVVYCKPDQRARLGVELVARGVLIEELHTTGTSLEEAYLTMMTRGAPA